jgi:predicted unusual protein kinase regulating ubiquinone biosynthesis (AarF/ABC1/UbiB family)
VGGFISKLFLNILLTSFLSISVQAKDTTKKPETKKDDASILRTKLSRKKTDETIEKGKVEQYRHLPDGIFKAPELFQMINKIVKRFQNTTLVDKSLRFQIMLASTPTINAWVSQNHELNDIKLYNVVVTKGFLDLLKNDEAAKKVLGNEFAQSLYNQGEGILAAVLAHEFGHAVNGDLEKITATTRVFAELNADSFGTKLLAEAGYDPHLMIELLESFDKLHGIPSLKKLGGTMLDEHPKSRFRVANILDLVNTLQNRDVAREKFNFPPSPMPKVEVNPIERNADREKASKTSVDGINKKLSADTYKQMPLRDKLNYLKQYFSTSDTTEGGMALESLARLGEEFKNLIPECKTAQDIRSIQVMFYDFENTLGDLAKSKGSTEKNNVKYTFRETKRAISAYKTKLFNELYPEGLTLENMPAWSVEMDSREIEGLLITQVKKATSLDQLKTILFGRQDNNFTFQEKYIRSGDSNTSAHLYAAIVTRSLELTNNVEETINFMQKVFVVNKGVINDIRIYSIVHLKEIFESMLGYVFEHENVNFGKINERLSHPQTAEDKTFSRMMSENANAIGAEWAKSNNKETKTNPIDSDFSYGSGTKYQIIRKITPDHIQFFRRLIGGDYTYHQMFFNEIANARYTLGQTLDILIEQNPNDMFWTDLKTDMTEERENNVGRDLNSQFRRIAEYMVINDYISEPEFKNTLQTYKKDPKPENSYDLEFLSTLQSAKMKQLSQAIQQSQNLHVDRLRDSLKLIGQTRDNMILTHEGEILKQPIASNIMNPLNISMIPLDRRVEIFKTIVDAQVRKGIEASTTKLAQYREEILEGLKELESEKRIGNSVIEEFMETFDLYLKTANEASKSDGAISSEFFVLQRKMRTMRTILEDAEAGLSSKITEKANTALKDSIASNDRLTSYKYGYHWIMKLLLNDPAFVRQYLKNPTQETEKQLSLSIIKDLATAVGHYEGLGEFDDLKDAYNLTVSQMTAKYVYHNVEARRRLRYSIAEKLFKQDVKAEHFNNYGQPTFIDITTLSKEELSQFLNVGSGFTEAMEHAMKASENPFLYNDMTTNMMNDLWVFSLHKAITEKDAASALAYTLSIMKPDDTDEHTQRVYFTLMERALTLVKDKDQMEAYTSLYALYLYGNRAFSKIRYGDYLKLGPEDLLKLTPYRYRELFFDQLAKKINTYDTWNGQKTKITAITGQFFINVIKYLHFKVKQYADGPQSYFAPLPYRIVVLKDTLIPFIVQQRWFQGAMNYLKYTLSIAYTKMIISRGLDAGSISTEDFFERVKESTLYSEAFDESISQYIKDGEFENASWWKTSTERKKAIGLLKLVRSMKSRQEVFDFLLKKYGNVKTGWIRSFRNYFDLLQAYVSASAVWTDEVLKDLENSNSIVEAWKIKEKAWEDFVKKRAAARGVTKELADKMLIDLYEAKKVVDAPEAAEISQVFMEGTRHRDGFIENIVKKKDTTFEKIKIFESFKSYNTETPLHKIAKAFFELMDEYIVKLEPKERADMALFITGVKEKLEPSTEEKIKKYFKGRTNRQRAVSKTGSYITLDDMKIFFKDTTPEEKMIALRALMLSGIVGNPEAESVVANPLLLSDPNMPPYLNKLLTIYLKVLNNSEKSIFLSWLLANYNGEPLRGPQIVQLLVEKGGVVSAKMAQVIASHGFNLPTEYQTVLEKFKGNAQKVDKYEVMKWIKERLPEGKFDEIKTIGRQLGSGSFKIGYLATLKDGRNVVIMLPREYVLEKTMREFEIASQLLQEVQKDTELRKDNLAAIEGEVQRIIREEMKISNEYKYMKAHKQAYEDRPILVRLFGNDVDVLIPQPIEGWSNEKILVEEYVQAKGWGDLPATSLGGWSQKALAEAAINEVLNQMLSYMNPNELVKRDGKVIIDIDPHEENQIAQETAWGGKDAMVNIDLGQSVAVEPEMVRGLVQMVAFIYLGQMDQAVEQSKKYMIYRSQADLNSFRDSLIKNKQASKDPFEILTRTFEDIELQGITLKPEFLFFQKLFATLIGLKRHVNDPNYIMKQAKKIMLLRAISNPGVFTDEVKEGYSEFKEMSKPEPERATAGMTCEALFTF